MSNEECGGNFLKSTKIDDYGEKVNTVLNQKVTCENDYQVKIVRYTTTPSRGFRFVWVDEFLHDDKFKNKFSQIIKKNTFISLINGKMSFTNKVTEECSLENTEPDYVALVSECKPPGLG